MQRYNAYIYLQRYAIGGGAAMQKDAEAPVQNLLPTKYLHM
jgi:hypothetical protein